MSDLYQALADTPTSPDAIFEAALQDYAAENYEAAESACRRVVELVPAHSAAWHMLGVLAYERDDYDGSLSCMEQALRFDPEHPVVYFNYGNALMGLKRFPEAVAAFRRALEIDPTDQRFIHNLALALQKLGSPNAVEEAETLLQRVVTLNPESAEAQANLGRFLRLLESSREDEAAEAFHRALELAPGASAIRADLADMYEQMNLLDKAAAELEAGFAIDPEYPDLYLVAAKLERRRGNLENAIRNLKALQASTKTGTYDRENHYESQMGLIRDAQGDTDAAFAHFAAANAVMRSRWRPTEADINALPDRIRRLRSTFSPEWIASWSEDTSERDYRPPLFLIGMPRSGTTLLDTMLGAHGGFDVLEEKPTTIELFRAIDTLPGSSAAEPEGGLKELNSEQFKTLRSTYFETVDRYVQRRDDALLLDKNPFNILNAGIIYRVMPDAKFILAVRHPCDVVLSCFMQNFSRAASTLHFHDIVDAAKLYVQVMDLWRHYISILPIQYHRIRYEDLVENTEAELRRLLAFAGAPWNDRALDHVDHATSRGMIRNPSYHQVSRPVYREARFRWLRYRKQMEPVLEILQPYIEYFGYPSPAESA
ncbi:MAG TPA: sulfotransferase [Gammaproteobacteria bacterium]|nr:sulfotransferase [Gammaproteobacteria bacterium]